MAKEKQTVELPNIFPLENAIVPHNVVVVGCGGTGAYVIGHITRLISVLNSERERYRKINLKLADGDKVEEKNLERQHFLKRELGTNKAVALAERYSAAFGLEITTKETYLEDSDDIVSLNPQLLITCVDNAATRKVAHDWFMNGGRYSSYFWIDAGNEENSGQVICGYNTYSSSHHGFNLPCASEVYPSIIEGGKFNSQLSCAELAAVAPQNMMANITASTLVLNFVQNILRNKPLVSHGVTFSVDNSFNTLLNTPENLIKLCPQRRTINEPWFKK